MFEKLNSIVYAPGGQKLIKCLTSRADTAAEKNALNVLGKSADVRSPRLFADESTEYTVCMEYIPGIRAYDLTAILNQFIRLHPDRGIARKSYELKHALVAAAIRNLRYFQDDSVQSALRVSAGSAMQPYPFVEKLWEAVEYLSAHFGSAADADLRSEVEEVASTLNNRAAVAFRDATLKNFILRFPEAGSAVSDFRDLVQPDGAYMRPTNWQWRDSDKIMPLLDHFGSANGLDDGFYCVDFESAHSLTTCEDDFLHIFTLEVLGIDYPAAEQYVRAKLGVSEEALNYAILLRCLRDGVRRLFYKCERPTIFSTRYYHETVEHNLLVALDALERLRKNTTRPCALDHLYRLVSRCAVGWAPRPWCVPITALEL